MSATAKRKSLPMDVRRLVLHEAGYKCANPVCRTILTLDIHHLDYVSDAGTDTPENLLALCPNCHALHHQGNIPKESLRSWKMLLLSMNEGFDRKAIDILLALSKMGWIEVSGEGMLECAALLASDLIKVEIIHGQMHMAFVVTYKLRLSERGRLLVEAWKLGDQKAAVDLPRA